MAVRPLRVMLVDDHALVRAAVRQALVAPDIEIIAEASTAHETLELAPQLHPDVLLMDINLPGADGLSLLRELVPRLPDTKIVMLTISEDRRDLMQAVRNGAAGYLTKDLGPDALQRAVRGTRSGDLAMSRAMGISSGVIETPSKRSRARTRAASPSRRTSSTIARTASRFSRLKMSAVERPSTVRRSSSVMVA